MKIRTGVLGATGMVGQKFIKLLEDHPFFEVTLVAASPKSAGKTYEEAVKNRWKESTPIPESIRKLIVKDSSKVKEISKKVDVIFSALNMNKDEIRRLEESYAENEIAVISNNSAHRWTEDVPMILPEVNPDHTKLIDIQRKLRGWKKGLIAVKPNCSIQSYVPVLNALMDFKPLEVIVTTFQAISGAGKTFDTWPEMIDNVIPFIGGEEVKSEKEPLKVWGDISRGKVINATQPEISANCVRVATSNGHMALVNVEFERKPTKEEFTNSIQNYKNPISKYDLPLSPKKFIQVFEKDNRPQTKLDRNFSNGMGISVGRIREDKILDWKFACLSHNTIRGAAGGAILMAELLYQMKYINSK
jgi:aspartate-semialdehyde dehydrogenase